MRDRFGLAEHGTTARREIAAGVTTFVTMSYIVCVQPALLGQAGMDPGAVLVATCLASALATLLMGLTARYPIALAPAMGHNFFFVFTVCGALGFAWPAALGANLVAGLLFLALSALNLQQRLVDAIPASLQQGIALGIGLFVAAIGLQWAGLVVDAPGTLVALGDLGSRPVLVALTVLAITAALTALRVRGAILLGMLCGLALAVPLGVARFHGVAAAPPSLAATAFRFDLAPLLHSVDLWTVVFVFLYLDLFDTMGTLVGLASQAGFLEEGRLPRSRAAFVSDAAGTVAGGLLGTSTVTSYIESATGIAAGGRTGLTAITVAVLFLLATLFFPLVRTLGEGVATAGGATLYPLTAPALVIVGALMMQSAGRVAWSEPVEAIPAFLAMVMIPLTFSITDGLTFGFIAASVLRLVAGRGLRTDPVLHAIALALLARLLFF